MITIGYVARRTVFNISTLRGLNQFVYILAVPALFFNASSHVSIRELLNFPALGAFVIAMLITGLLTVFGCHFMFAVQGAEKLTLRGLNGVFANYAYMGISLTFGILGDQSHAATISIVLTSNLFIVDGGQLLLESFRQKSIGLIQMLSVLDRSLLRNPIFVATALGVFYRRMSLSLIR